MRYARTKQLTAAAGVLSTLTLGAFDVRAADSVTIAQLVAMGPLPMSELVAKASPSGKAAAKRASAPKKSRGKKGPTHGISVGELTQAAPMAFGELLLRASGKAPKGTPQGIATALPKEVKVPTVTVTIPASPTARPIATMAQIATVKTQAPTSPAPLPVAAPVFTPPAVKPDRAQPLATTTDALTLEIIEASGKLAFNPQGLVFPKTGTTAQIRMGAKGMKGLSLFVRDQNVVSLNEASGELKARKKGVTELYAVLGGKMYIVPMTVEDAGGEWDLKVPDALVSLDGVFHGTQQSALYPGLDKVGPSLNDSVAETAKAVAAQAADAGRFYDARTELGYRSVSLQIVDERSSQGRLYPVANAQVRIVGTEFSARTDATGHLTIRDMPQGSRFLVRVDDPSGGVKPSLAELTVKDGVTRVRVMRSFTFDAYASIAGVAPHAALGSYCGTLVDAEGDGSPMAGVHITTDVGAEGPYFFNRYGFLDRAQDATGADGRFCFLNVTPGPLALSVFEGQTFVAMLPVSAYAGRHVEEELPLGDGVRFSARLAAMPTAHEQLGADQRLAHTYKSIDMVDLIPLGTQDPLMQIGPGLVASQDTLLPMGGRLRAFAQAAEFEPVVYTFPAGTAQAVTPLVPRGFVEDMSLYAQVAHNPEHGVVLVEYGHPAGAETTIGMRLVDQEGRDVGDGWYFSDQPVTKAIFFNVPAGTYGLLVETNDRYWLGGDTVMVYNETVSYLRMGSAVRYRR